MSRYFPLFISLKGKKITVVGAGTVAARRIRTLLAFEPELVVIAPEAAEEVQALADEGTICWEKREFAPGQIEGSLVCSGGGRQKRGESCCLGGMQKTWDSCQQGGRSRKL